MGSDSKSEEKEREDKIDWLADEEKREELEDTLDDLVLDSALNNPRITEFLTEHFDVEEEIEEYPPVTRTGNATGWLNRELDENLSEEEATQIFLNYPEKFYVDRYYFKTHLNPGSFYNTKCGERKAKETINEALSKAKEEGGSLKEKIKRANELAHDYKKEMKKRREASEITWLSNPKKREELEEALDDLVADIAVRHEEVSPKIQEKFDVDGESFLDKKPPLDIRGAQDWLNRELDERFSHEEVNQILLHYPEKFYVDRHYLKIHLAPSSFYFHPADKEQSKKIIDKALDDSKGSEEELEKKITEANELAHKYKKALEKGEKIKKEEITDPKMRKGLGTEDYLEEGLKAIEKQESETEESI